MIPNLESLSNVSGVSLWLREMALDFAGKYLSQMVEKSLSSTIQREQFLLIRPQRYH